MADEFSQFSVNIPHSHSRPKALDRWNARREKCEEHHDLFIKMVRDVYADQKIKRSDVAKMVAKKSSVTRKTNTKYKHTWQSIMAWLSDKTVKRLTVKIIPRTHFRIETSKGSGEPSSRWVQSTWCDEKFHYMNANMNVIPCAESRHLVPSDRPDIRGFMDYSRTSWHGLFPRSDVKEFDSNTGNPSGVNTDIYHYHANSDDEKEKKRFMEMVSACMKQLNPIKPGNFRYVTLSKKAGSDYFHPATEFLVHEHDYKSNHNDIGTLSFDGRRDVYTSFNKKGQYMWYNAGFEWSKTNDICTAKVNLYTEYLIHSIRSYFESRGVIMPRELLDIIFDYYDVQSVQFNDDNDN